MSAAASGGVRSVRAALRRALPYFIAAAVCIIVGGALAAATAYVTTQKTAWATAYIVLVGGVAQAVLGAALGWIATHARMPVVWTAFVLWNLANIGVVAGQLTGVIALTFLGGAAFVIALILIIVATLRAGPAHPVLLWAFRIVVVLLVVSTPTGLVLAALGR
ncbi:hypothetical protein GCM10022240_27890 [Microbacterium kribbense]|uniref:Uncharacterized protein n=1 Tax=Microbacterium kribbense TaxID=433645 RepID=A0ABP7GT27_9MICO